MRTASLETVSEVNALIGIAIQGLASMYDAGNGTFGFNIDKQGATIRNSVSSNESTLIALLGMNEAFQYDLKVPIDIETITHQRIHGATSFDSLGELGLLIWLTARTLPEALPLLYDRIDWPYSLDQFTDARTGKTRELCWLLAGLSEIRLSDGEEPLQLDELAHMTRQLLFVNYGGFGIFSHQAKGGFKNRSRVRYGSFADQAFSIYAFSRYARAFMDEQALAIASVCSRRMVECQGELGQWWWLYDVESGDVVRSYPVYAVHQDGLAPMALTALSELTGDNFSEAIRCGLQWLLGANELSMNLVVPDCRAIWDSVQDSRYPMDIEDFNSTITFRPSKKGKRTLHLMSECTPRHLGWLLYALSGYAG